MYCMCPLLCQADTSYNAYICLFFSTDVLCVRFCMCVRLFRWAGGQGRMGFRSRRHPDVHRHRQQGDGAAVEQGRDAVFLRRNIPEFFLFY